MKAPSNLHLNTFNISYSPTAFIDLKALQDNLNQVRQRAPGKKVLAMIKANAYGHGLITIAQALSSQVEAFGVARIEEAVMLRQAKIDDPIVLMSGFFTTQELALIDQLNLSTVIHSSFQVEMLAQSHLTRPLTVWIKINTGMHRFGFSQEQFHIAYRKLTQHLNIKKIIFMSHFACADQSKLATESQYERFQQIIAKYEKHEVSLANSATIIEHNDISSDWVRPGLMLYGASPISPKTGKDLGLRPVMTLKARILAIQKCPVDSPIGYGYRYTCTKDMAIGIVSIGYGDGYPRGIPAQGTPVLVRNQQTEVIGRVAMDSLSINLSAIPEAQTGDLVTLWGEGLPVEYIAQKAEKISYELLCGIQQRVHYRLKPRAIPT